MAEDKTSWIDIIIKEGVRAATWAIVLLVIMTAFLSFVKQDIKEAIDFGTKRAFYEAAEYAFNPFLIGKGKQLIKEGVEYSIERVGDKYKEVLLETMQAAYTEKVTMDKKE